MSRKNRYLIYYSQEEKQRGNEKMKNKNEVLSRYHLYLKLAVKSHQRVRNLMTELKMESIVKTHIYREYVQISSYAAVLGWVLGVKEAETHKIIKRESDKENKIAV